MIRANASEVIALANMWGLNTETVGDASEHRPAGVESVDDVESATGAAVALAQYLTEQHAKHSSHDASTRCAVAVSGIADLVTDGETVYRLPGGSAMMTKITGAGCSLGGVAATYLAVSDPLTAACPRLCCTTARERWPIQLRTDRARSKLRSLTRCGM